MNSSIRLSGSTRCHVIAPAGCGKTHLIAQAVAEHATGCELILTHTHAGVDALRRKLRELGARSCQFKVDTIAGWALRYAAAYPASSGLSTTKPKANGWKEVYGSASTLLKRKHVGEVIRASYTGVYVDEYQDCTVEQHDLVLELAALLPCRILGDPLQGIFGFKNNVLIDWNAHVTSDFPELSVLDTPWRWKTKCPDLGRWLMTVREAILNSSPINLASAPYPHVRWIRLPSDKSRQFVTQMQACRSMSGGGSTIAIHQWERQCNRLVNTLAPMYCNIETIECEDLLTSTAAIQATTGIQRIDAVVSFASECFSGVRKELQTVIDASKRNQPPGRREYKHQHILTQLLAIANDDSLAPVLSALEVIKTVNTLTLWRKELFFAMCQSLREFAEGGHQTLEDAAWAVRNRTRRVGRRLGIRAVGRTLLVKGLEFDHCVVLDADSLGARDLYVALTRPSRTLTVLSNNRILRPLM